METLEGTAREIAVEMDIGGEKDKEEKEEEPRRT